MLLQREAGREDQASEPEFWSHLGNADKIQNAGPEQALRSNQEYLHDKSFARSSSALEGSLRSEPYDVESEADYSQTVLIRDREQQSAQWGPGLAIYEVLHWNMTWYATST